MKNGSSSVQLHTLDTVEEALVECHDLWRRTPGGGLWPFAGDGPWHLMQGEAGDYAGEGKDGVSSSRTPRPPLDAAEVARRDAVTAWLDVLEDPVDRKVVWLATNRLQAGEGRVPWREVKRWLDYARTATNLAWRYRMALGTVGASLEGRTGNARLRRARSMAAEGFTRDKAD